jgi:hypothetical protein
VVVDRRSTVPSLEVVVLVVVREVAGSLGATTTGGVVDVSLTVLLKQPIGASKVSPVPIRAARRSIFFIRFVRLRII